MILNRIERVAVIGAGIVGASIALRVAQRGLAVTLYDAGAFAAEASAAGAGMLAPGGEANQFAEWARATVEARALYRDFVTELREASGHPIDYRECGAIDLAFDDAEWEVLTERRAIQSQLGIGVETLTMAEARRLAPALALNIGGDGTRAMWFAGDAIVNPRDVTKALALMLGQLSVTILEHCPVSACTWDGTHFQLTSSSAGSLGEARAVVIAAGAWAGTIDLNQIVRESPQPPREAMPIRGHLIQCKQEPGTLGPIIRHQHLYVFQRQSGDVVAGSNEERAGFDRTPNQEALTEIHAHTNRLLPGLFPTVADTYWLGFRPGITGSGPEVRRLGELPLWLAYGHYRNGILLAPHTADKVTGEIAASFGTGRVHLDCGN